MSSSHEVFSQYLETVQQRTQDLLKEASATPLEQSTLVMSCLSELQNSLEELHTAEAELRQQHDELILTQCLVATERQRYADLFEFAPDAYFVTNLYGIVQEANLAACRLLDMDHDFLIGKLLISFVPEDRRRSFRTLLNQLPTVHRVQEWEVSLGRIQGRSVDVALTVEIAQNPAGNPTMLRWLMRDISTRKQAEAQLHQMQQQNLELLESDHVKSQFIATVSHELRTPMTAILGFSELLLRRCQQQHDAQQNDAQIATLVEPILRNGKHLLKIIEELLDFSKLQTGHLPLRLECFDLKPLIWNTVTDLRSLADQKVLDLQVRLPDQPLQITNDPNRLRQVLVNLLANAIKFTEAGRVTIAVEFLPSDRLLISVQDTGIGIETSNQAQIFQQFWQANPTLNRRYSGTGLGLAISKALVELMQGSITVESRVREGSTFRINIPCQVHLNRG